MTDLNTGKQIGRLNKTDFQVPPILNMGRNFDEHPDFQKNQGGP